ncbi:unnamed protein product [Gadus morhua 'NCC']
MQCLCPAEPCTVVVRYVLQTCIVVVPYVLQVLNKSLQAQSAVQPRPPLTRAHNDSLNQRLAITAAAH